MKIPNLSLIKCGLKRKNGVIACDRSHEKTSYKN
jgi:hypothetical protein